MKKIKKGIVCLITAALIGTSLPWTAFAQSVRVVKPVGTQVSGIAGLSPSTQLQPTSAVTFAPAAAGDLKLPAPTVLPGAADPALTAPASPAVTALPEPPVPTGEAAPAAAEGEAPAAGKIEKAPTRGRFDGSVIFDHVRKFAGTVDVAGGMDPTPVKFTERRKYAPGYGRGILKAKDKINHRIYYQAPNGTLVPVNGDVAGYLQPARLTLYKSKSKQTGPIYIVAPSGRSSLKNYEADLEVLASDALARGARLQRVLDRLGRPARARGATKEFSEKLKEFQRELAEYRTAQEAWTAKKNELYGRAKEADAPFLKAVIDGADFGKSHADLSFQALVQERFANADALMAALYPEYIKDLRRYIPNLNSLGVADFDKSVFNDPELTLEFIKYRKAYRNRDVPAIGTLSQAQIAFSPETIPAALDRLAAFQKPSLKPLVPEARALVLEALAQTEKARQALDKLDAAIRSADSEKDVRGALKEANAALAAYTTEREAWKPKRDVFYAKAKDADKLFLTALIDGADFKKIHKKNIAVGALLTERFATADDLLSALYPDHIKELRRDIPNLKSLPVTDFEFSIFVDRELTLEFLENQRSRGEAARQNLRLLSRVGWAFTPKDILALLERLAKDKGPLKSIQPALSELANESLRIIEQWEKIRDRLQTAFAEDKPGKTVAKSLDELRRMIVERQSKASGWQARRDALLDKLTDDAQIRDFVAYVAHTIDPKRNDLNSLLAAEFRTADELLSWLYPKRIEELRLYIPDLKSMGVSDFQSSLFLHPELTDEFIENRKSLGRKDIAAIGALSYATFDVSPKSIPAMLSRLEKHEDGVLKPYEAELQGLVNEATPALAQWDRAMENLKRAVADKGGSKKAGAILAELGRMTAERQADASGWRQKGEAFLGKVSDPVLKSFLTQMLTPLDPNPASLNTIMSARFHNADELLAWLHPQRIEELRRFMPGLSAMQIDGFERSIFVDRDKVGEFLANRALLGESAPQSQSSGLQDVRYVVPMGRDQLRPKFKSGDFRLPYRVPDVQGLEDFSDPNNPGYATFRPDATPGAAKEKLKERFGIFSDLIEANFRVLPIISRFSFEPMPKAAGRAIVAEVGTMVTHYETLTKSAQKAADGQAVRERYTAIAAELEQLWKDVPETGTLPEAVAERISSIEPGAELAAIQNLHTMVNFIHQRSFEALSAREAAGNERGAINFKNEIPFMDLGDQPVFKNNHLLSKPLRALLNRDQRPGGHQTDIVIIRGDEAWVHASLGLHSAEIYVKFADPDDGGMLRIRYQEGTNTPIGNPARLALVREEHMRLGIHTEVEDTRPRDEKTGKPLPTFGRDPLHLVSIIDKDHGLTSEKQLEGLFSFTLQGLHDTLDMNCAFDRLGEDGCAKVVPQLADIYIAEGRWAEGWNKGGNYHGFYEGYMARQNKRVAMRAALDKELARLGLPAIPGDAVMGQAAVEKYFTAAVNRALIRGELKWDDDAIPQRQNYRPVEALATDVQGHRDAAEAAASVLGHFESELEYEPIGAVGAMRADRAIWQFGDQALVLYGLREPETGTLGYAAAFRHDPAAGLTKLDAEGLVSFLWERGIVAPAPESLSGAQKAMLEDWLRRKPSSRSPLSGTRVDGLAASAGQGGLVTASVTFDRKGKRGAALIVPYTTPDDLDAIKNAAAVVTTGGGLLSHAAITTRELGLASVILPRAEWKKTAAGKDKLELTTYEPEGAAVHVAGTVVRPRLRPVRLTLQEGDRVRVNGATGEMYLFPKASGSRKAGAVAFAVEEALFNPLKRSSAGTMLSKLLAHTREDIRQQARDHGGRLFEDRLTKAKSNIPAESEAGAASIAAFHAEIKRLDEMAALFSLKTDALAPLKVDEERLRKALAKREEAALIAAWPEIARLNSTKPTTADLPAVRRLVRLLQSPAAEKVYLKSTVGLFSSLERRLSEEKQRNIKNMAPSVLPLGVVDDDYRILVGGKLSKLGEILAVVRKTGGYVPEALAVTTEAYRRFLRENDLEKPLRVLAEQLDTVLSSEQSEEARQKKVAGISKQIRTLLLSGKLDPESGVGKEIWEGMQARGLAADGRQLAIRSSAVQEDTADAAFAGAAESYLHVKPEEALHKVIENWTSFWLPRGIVYRHQQKIPSTSLAASTIIQEMAEADVAGVLFTQNPVTGADEFVINAAYGLGEGIVSGIVQTDRYVARKSDGQETKLPFIGDKRVAVMPKSGASGTELQGVAAERRKRRAITPEQTQRLTLIAKALEAHFGYPLDIEFAVKGERIAILQARPVTTRGQAEGIQAEEKGPVVVKVPRPEAPSQKPAVSAAPAKKKIVFVCTGNACRSPMAEFFAQDMLAKEGNVTVEVFSRGVHARDGGTMSPDSLYQLELGGIDGRSHRSHKLRVEDVRNADYILAMDQSNVDDILRKFPGAGGKTYLLKEFSRTGTGDVENPWPAIGRAYEETAAEIVAAVDEIARLIQSGERKLKSVVFACSFNTSRSPMAEYFAKEELKRLGIKNVKVISRSLYAQAHIGKPMNWKAQELLASLEIDGSKHESTPLTQQEAKDADVILVMDSDNLDDIAKRFPEAHGKAFLLKQFAKTGTGGIENPSKKIFRAYDKAGKEIKEAVGAVIDKASMEAEPEPDPTHRKKRVTFVCTGDACRSPMAEDFAKDMLAKDGKTDVEVFSRAAKGGFYSSFGGVSDYPFGGPPRGSAGGMPQGSKGLTLRDVMRSDVLLAMDEENLDDILRRFPEAEGKTFLLKEFAGTGTGDIDNPAFGNASSRYMAYQQTAKEITAAVKVVAKAAASAERKLKSIMFACTWNTSRSPMAEYYAKDELQKLGVKDVRVFSRSVGVHGGRSVGFGSSGKSFPPYNPPMKGEALANLAVTGIDGREHKSTPMSAEDVAGSDVILVMEKEHVDNIVKRFPEAKGKVFLLNEFAGLGASEIENPSKTASRFADMKAETEIKEAVRAAIDKGFTPPAPQTEAAPQKSVLFVCTANHSRSPLAERLFRERLRREGIADVDVWSRGLSAFRGGSMADLSEDVLRRKGIPVEPHSGRGLTIRDIRRATMILVMEPFQKREVEFRYPSAKGKVFTMKEYGGGEGSILDHVRTIDAFLDMADQMEAAFDALVGNLKK